MALRWMPCVAVVGVSLPSLHRSNRRCGLRDFVPARMPFGGDRQAASLHRLAHGPRTVGQSADGWGDCPDSHVDLRKVAGLVDTPSCRIAKHSASSSANGSHTVRQGRAGRCRFRPTVIETVGDARSHHRARYRETDEGWWRVVIETVEGTSEASESVALGIMTGAMPMMPKRLHSNHTTVSPLNSAAGPLATTNPDRYPKGHGKTYRAKGRPTCSDRPETSKQADTGNDRPTALGHRGVRRMLSDRRLADPGRSC